MGGKKLGESLMQAGMKEDEAVKRVLDLFEHCKVGKVSMGETLRMVQNCESFMVKADEPSCSFTTASSMDSSPQSNNSMLKRRNVSRWAIPIASGNLGRLR